MTGLGVGHAGDVLWSGTGSDRITSEALRSLIGPATGPVTVPHRPAGVRPATPSSDGRPPRTWNPGPAGHPAPPRACTGSPTATPPLRCPVRRATNLSRSESHVQRCESPVRNVFQVILDHRQRAGTSFDPCAERKSVGEGKSG